MENRKLETDPSSLAVASRAFGGERALLFAVASIIPAAVLFLTCITLVVSVFDDIPTGHLKFTIQHYLDIYADPFVYLTLGNTLLFSVISTTVSLAFGVPIAWLAQRTTMAHKGLLYALMTIGLLVPTFFTAIGWVVLLHPKIGFLNVWLAQLTGSSHLTVSINTITGMGFVQGLSLTPIAFIMTTAAFRAMNPMLEEAASIHGLEGWSILRKITLPLAYPSIAAAAIYIFMIGVAAFDIPAMMGLSNRIYTFSTLIYIKTLNSTGAQDYGLPAAVGMLMFVVAIFVTVWYGRFLRSSDRYALVSGKAYTTRQLKLSRWGNIGAWTFCATFMSLSIGIPLLLVIWVSLTPYLQPPSFKALQLLTLDQFRDLDWSLILRGAKNTAILMLVAPAVTIVLAVPLAWVIVRSQSRWRYIYEFLSFLPHSLPPIVFASSALFASLFVLGDMFPLYGTVALIAIIYVVESIAFVSRVLNSALIQIHRELEEVGYVSGLGIVSVLRRIFVPLVLPAILGVWLWRVLITYRELTVATVLLTPNNITLPVVVWSQWIGIGLGPAAAVTLIIVAALAPLIFIYWIIIGRRFLEG